MVWASPALSTRIARPREPPALSAVPLEGAPPRLGCRRIDDAEPTIYGRQRRGTFTEAGKKVLLLQASNSLVRHPTQPMSRISCSFILHPGVLALPASATIITITVQRLAAPRKVGRADHAMWLGQRDGRGVGLTARPAINRPAPGPDDPRQGRHSGPLAPGH